MDSQAILSFWFKEIEPSKWWIKDLKFDEMVDKRFAEVHRAASCCEFFHWRGTEEGRLAEIIVLDQFSRNMYRDIALSFAVDSVALALTQEAISLGADKYLKQTQ